MSEGQFLSFACASTTTCASSSRARSLNATVTGPQAMIDIENGYKNETRDIEFFKIDAAKKVTVSRARRRQAAAYYNDNKASFMTPDTASSTCSWPAQATSRRRSSSRTKELKASYEADKATYDTPEKRRVQQIAFKDKATAEAARDALVKGTKNFMDVAKDNAQRKATSIWA